jgi:hypothetical protein
VPSVERLTDTFVNPAYQIFVQLLARVGVHKLYAGPQAANEATTSTAHQQVHFHRHYFPGAQLTVNVIAGDASQIPAH